MANTSYIYTMKIISTDTIKIGMVGSEARLKERKGENGRKYGNGSKDCYILSVAKIGTVNKALEAEELLKQACAQVLTQVAPKAQGPDSERFIANDMLETVSFSFTNRKAKIITMKIAGNPDPIYNKDNRANNGRKPRS